MHITTRKKQVGVHKLLGITLLELLVVIAILSILSAQAIPEFKGWINTLRLRSTSELFFQSLAMARSEAIKRNERTVVCRSESGIQCDVAGNWRYGWIVFGDTNGNAQFDPGEALIFRQPALPEKMRFSGNTNVARYVSYTPTGVSKIVGGALQMGSFIICMESATPTDARKVLISKPGQVRIEKLKVENCL